MPRIAFNEAPSGCLVQRGKARPGGPAAQAAPRGVPGTLGLLGGWGALALDLGAVGFGVPVPLPGVATVVKQHLELLVTLLIT